MWFSSIAIQDFRNFAALRAEFGAGSHFVIGRNAQGKTNLLEALSLVSHLRSFRMADSDSMIRWGAKPAQARIIYRIQHPAMGDTEVDLSFSRSSKRILLDGNPVRRMGELIGQFPTVAFSSQDIQVLRGPPALRRRFLDMLFVDMQPGYYERLSRYHTALKSRNLLLKQRAGSGARRGFEEQLIIEGWGLCQWRRELINTYAVHFAHAYRLISGIDEVPELVYAPSLDAVDQQAYAAGFWAQLQRDTDFCQTHKGPHRDELDIRLQGHPAREFASEGQQRGLVLAMRMGVVEWHRARAGIQPVILADDIVGELDACRRAGFWKLIGSGCQVFASGTAAPVEDDSHAWQFWQMDAGRMEVP